MSNIIISPQSGIIEFNTGIAGSDSLMTSTAPIRLDATGGDIWFTGSNVGIGTTDPQFTLDVEGAIHGTSGNFSTAITVGGNPVMTGDSPEADTLQTVTNRGSSTTNPISALAITGTAGLNQFKGSTADSSSNTIVARNSSNTSLFSIRNDGRVDIPVGPVNIGNNLYLDNNEIWAQNSNNLNVKAAGDVKIQPNDGATTAATFKSDGNVGIGTTSPNSNLHVYAASNAPTFRISRASNGQVWNQTIDSSARFLLQEAASEGGTLNTRLSIDDAGETLLCMNGGSCGIGTVSVNQNGSKTTLDIHHATVGAAIRLRQASNSALIRYDDTDGLQVGTIASKNLSFETADITAITIDTSQNVGIGTTGPDSRLHVVGSADSDAASLGSEIVASQTASGTNWSGSSIATGYTHTAGSADVLLSTLNATTNRLYRVEIETTNVTAGRLDKVSFGGIETTVYITNNQTRVLSVKAISTGPLTFECQSAFVGTVTVSSVKEIAASDSLSVLTNSGGSGRLETRVFSTTDFFLGDSAGENRVSSGNNIGIGNFALQKIGTAGINLAIGNRSLSNLTNGQYNVAIGHDILGNYQKMVTFIT